MRVVISLALSLIGIEDNHRCVCGVRKRESERERGLQVHTGTYMPTRHTQYNAYNINHYTCGHT